jgi:hypothetical protein
VHVFIGVSGYIYTVFKKNTVVVKGGRWTKLAPGEIEQKQ